MGKKKSAKQVTFGQGKKRAEKKAEKKPKAEKPKKAKAEKRAKAMPDDGTMDEHATLVEIRRAEARLRKAEAAKSEWKEDGKAIAGEVSAATKALRDLAGDVTDGQSRINFSKPVEEYHRQLPEVKPEAPKSPSTLPNIPDELWRGRGIVSLDLSDVIKDKFYKAELETLGQVSDWMAKPFNHIDKLLAPKQLEKYEEATAKVFAEIRSRMTNVVEPPSDDIGPCADEVNDDAAKNEDEA